MFLLSTGLDFLSLGLSESGPGGEHKKEEEEDKEGGVSCPVDVSVSTGLFLIIRKQLLDRVLHF